MKQYLWLALALATSSASAGNLRLGIGYGTADMGINAKANTTDIDIGDPALVTSLKAGYQFENKLFTEIAITAIEDDFLFDFLKTAELDSVEFNIGYTKELGSFYLEPKIGMAMWRLRLEDDLQIETDKGLRNRVDGFDPSAGITIGYHLSENINMSLGYQALFYDYGTANTLQLGVNITL